MKKVLVVLTILLIILTLSGCGDISGTDIKSACLTINGDAITGSVSNTTSTFSFLNDITVSKGASYAVSRDIYGSDVIATKTVSLTVGDNTFYILVTAGNDMKLYTVTIRRLPMYYVSFNTMGGSSVASMRIEEGGTIAPPSVPVRAGYTFAGWEYDFTTPIMDTTTIKASWQANSDTKYTVEYYLENINKDGYDKVETVTLEGTTGTTATANRKSFEHFTYSPNKSTISGSINGEGKLVLKVYYTRDSYRVSSSAGDGGTVTSVNAKYPYGTEITFTATEPNLGYTFLGFYIEDDKVCETRTYTCKVDKTVSIVAKYELRAEMSNFIFNSTPTACVITGIRDLTIRSLEVPNYVNEISSGTFSGCSSLTSVTIPDSVTSIGDDAFYGCSSLTLIQVNNNSLYKSIDGNLYTYDGSKLLQYAIGKKDKTFVIPDSVTSIGDDAFYNCSSLTNITIPDSVTSIGGSAFSGCSNLTSIAIGSGVKSIGDDAFYNCSSLTNITIPDSVTSIGSSVFSGCGGLSTISIPFVGATKSGTSDTHFGYIFGASNYSYNDDYVPSSLKSVVITGGSSIDHGAFWFCSNLTSITIPDSVTSIGNSAFSGCSSLMDVTIPKDVTRIGCLAFNGCSSLTSITFSSSAGTWYQTRNSDYTDGTPCMVLLPSHNATYFRDTSYYWYKIMVQNV